jgi:hypothetical protein
MPVRGAGFTAEASSGRTRISPKSSVPASFFLSSFVAADLRQSETQYFQLSWHTIAAQAAALMHALKALLSGAEGATPMLQWQSRLCMPWRAVVPEQRVHPAAPGAQAEDTPVDLLQHDARGDDHPADHAPLLVAGAVFLRLDGAAPALAAADPQAGQLGGPLRQHHLLQGGHMARYDQPNAALYVSCTIAPHANWTAM